MGAVPLGEAGVDRVRAFFGLPLPDEHREVLEGFLASCRAIAPEFRWTLAENLHLTVRFLGQVDLTLAEGIADRLGAPHSFELRLGDLGTFRRGRLARVVWLGLRAGVEELGGLAAAVEAECFRAGLEPESRAFNPHLTLARARARDRSSLPVMPDAPDLPAWRAEELILYRSRPGKGGSVYEPLRRIRLS